MVLTLEADDFKMMQWCVDASFAAHDNVQGHTGGALTMGKGSVHSESIEQNGSDWSG